MIAPDARSPLQYGLISAVEIENARLRKLLLQAGVDRETSEIAAKLQKALIGELHHRVKNTLAIVSSVVAQSLRSSPDLETALAAIGERLAALGTAHDLLLREAWTGAGLRSIVDAAVLAFDAKSSDRIEIEGDDILIASASAISISLMLHELCTNAVKYGALSVPEGRVSVVWFFNETAGRFHLTWKELGGAARCHADPAKFRHQAHRAFTARPTRGNGAHQIRASRPHM